MKMFRIKTTNRSDHLTSHESQSTGRKISKPVKIAELFGPSKQSRNVQTNSTATIRLPERLTPFIRNASNRKKTETTSLVKLSHNNRTSRRNLNFTKVPILVTNNSNKSLREEDSHLSTRRSFLLPPNTIKDSYMKNKFKQNKSMLPQPCISSYSKYDNKYSRISENSISCPSSVRVTNVQVDSVTHEEINNTSIQHTPSQIFDTCAIANVNDQSGIGILHSIHADTKNDTVKKEISKSSTKVESPINEEEKCLSMTINDFGEDSHQFAQDIQIINQPCLNLNHNANTNDECVTINQRNLIALASMIKHNICKLENMLPNLKFTYNAIMDILSTKNVTNKESDNNDIKIMREETENDVKTINNVCTESLCIISSEDNIDSKESINIDTMDNINTNESINIDTKESNNIDIKENINIEKGFITDASNILKEIYKTPVSKKNTSGIRLSRQIDSILESDKENDSFLVLENKLDIKNIKSNTTIVTITKSTPMSIKYKNKKEEKPLKEYMALKSRMSCLLTPNIKHLNSSQSKNDNLHSDSSDAKATISGKILAELYHLYED